MLWNQTPAERPFASTTEAAGDHTFDRLEREIAETCADLGRTAAELGARLAPSSLLANARDTVREAAIDATRATVRSAGHLAADTAERTYQVAVDATTRARTHPLAAAAAGATATWLVWALGAQGRRQHVASRSLPVALAWAGVWLLWRGSGTSDRRPLSI